MYRIGDTSPERQLEQRIRALRIEILQKMGSVTIAEFERMQGDLNLLEYKLYRMYQQRPK